MKRVLGLVIAGVLAMNVSVTAAEGKDVVPVTTALPVVTSIENTVYEIEKDGKEMFSILVSENATTGYVWTYTIDNEALVIVDSEMITRADEDLLGAPSVKKISFKALEKGVSTIKFEKKRLNEDEAIAGFSILVYKTDDQLFVEEDLPVYAMDADKPESSEKPMDSVSPILYTVGEMVTYKGVEVVADVKVQVINGVTMVPLRASLEAMGFSVTWNNETQSVDMNRGAQWTSITIDKNAYFKNKMAAQELSAAPIIVNDRTLVPVEFFGEILSIGTDINSKQINFTDNESVIHTGFVKSISYDETGMKTLTLTSDMSSESPELQVIIHTSSAYSVYQKEVKEGDLVTVIASMVMTMSMPGQTTGYVIY